MFDHLREMICRELEDELAKLRKEAVRLQDDLTTRTMENARLRAIVESDELLGDLARLDEENARLREEHGPGKCIRMVPEDQSEEWGPAI